MRSLASGPCFYFSELPDAFREALIAAHVSFPTPDFPATVLTQTNVVAERFAGAYRRACECACLRGAKTLFRVGWREVSQACREESWFAEKPELLSALAKSLNQEQTPHVAEWVALCRVLGENSDGKPVQRMPRDLFARKLSGNQYLPQRFLNRVSAAYDDLCCNLLRCAGLRVRP